MLDLKLKNLILGLIVDIELELGLTNEPSQAKLKLLYFITSLNLNIICRLVSSSSQAWTFYFCYRAELKHSLLDKSRLVYCPSRFRFVFFSSSFFYEKKGRLRFLVNNNKRLNSYTVCTYNWVIHDVCKVEFNQPSCWLYFVPNLLVI